MTKEVEETLRKIAKYFDNRLDRLEHKINFISGDVVTIKGDVATIESELDTLSMNIQNTLLDE